MTTRFFEDMALSGPIGTISTAPPRPLPFAPGVFHLALSGQVGPDAPISLARVQQKLAGAHYGHVHIDLNSSGGDSDEGFRLYDFLRSLPAPISVRVGVQCYSAGLDILLAGSYRFAAAHAMFLVHPTSRAGADLPNRVTSRTLADASAALAQTDTRVVDLLSNRTGTSRDFFEKEIQTEDPMTAVEAFSCGLLHEISGLTPKVDPSWPDVFRSQQFGKILIDRKLFAPSFLGACRTAGSLYTWPGTNG